MSGPEFDDRGQAWTVFFGVAAIVIAGLVLVSRVVAAVDGSHGGGLLAAAPAQLASAPVVAAAESTAIVNEALGGQRMGGTAIEPSAGGGVAVAEPDATPASRGPAGEAPATAPTPVQPATAVEPATTSEPAASVPPAAPAPTEPPPAPPPPPPSPTPPPAPQLPPAPAVSARSVAIVERSCGALVYGLNENERLPPASITKIVAALVAVDRITNLNALVQDTHISAKEMVRTSDSSVMGIEPGTTYSVRDLMYGLILPSGNDAALQLAEYLTGSSQTFVALMNAKAASLGMTNTTFMNPHGLDTPGHLSTALDMAKAGRAFLANPFLAQIAVTPQYEAGTAVRILMKNGNKLLQSYPGAFGVKIGYTTNARQTFVAAANHNGRELIVSIMGSDDRYADATALLDWAFATRPSAC